MEPPGRWQFSAGPRAWSEISGLHLTKMLAGLESRHRLRRPNCLDQQLLKPMRACRIRSLSAMPARGANPQSHRLRLIRGVAGKAPKPSLSNCRALLRERAASPVPPGQLLPALLLQAFYTIHLERPIEAYRQAESRKFGLMKKSCLPLSGWGVPFLYSQCN
jgi:hypothetical protein